MPAPYLQQAGAQPPKKEEICLFAQTNFRNQMRRFGIKLDDRRRHMYIIGKTGMGKSTMMENMMLHDIYSGHGVGLVDPHGDFAEKIIDFIPSHRMNDVVYLNPSDTDFPIGFNILEVKNEEQKHLVAAGLMGTFKKIWPDVWSARMEYILNNTLLALLEYPNSTLLGINSILSDKKFRQKVVRKVKDPVIKGFWNNEFANYEDRYAKEAVAPIQNKIGQFLSAALIRNMVAQVKSTINVRDLMDQGKILIMNLSKGRMGEDNSRLLGGMLITKIQLSAMERVDIPEHERKDFFLYVDEFQNFATPSFANILSEARKYHLGLVMAHQYVKQLDEVVADAVFGNVGTIVTFRVGAGDAEMLAKEFAPTFLEEDIVNLAKYRVLLKLMIDGVASQPFSALTLPPIASRTGSTEKVIKVSRERYAKPRTDIEDKIARWSGLEGGEEASDDDEDDVDDFFKKKDQQKKQEEKEEYKPGQGQSKGKDEKGNKSKNEKKEKMNGVKPEKKFSQDASVQPLTQNSEKKKQERDLLTPEATQPKVAEAVSLTSLPPREDVVKEKKKESEKVLDTSDEILFDAQESSSASEAFHLEHDSGGGHTEGSQHTNANLQDPNQPNKKKRKRRKRKKKNQNNQENGGNGNHESVAPHVGHSKTESSLDKRLEPQSITKDESGNTFESQKPAVSEEPGHKTKQDPPPSSTKPKEVSQNEAKQQENNVIPPGNVIRFD